MAIVEKDGQKFKTRSHEFNWNHVMDMVENMQRIQKVLLPFKQEEDRRQRKLKEFPKGFHLNGKGYSCAICGGSCSDEETWYDQYGIKCMECQAAVDRGEIPAYCAKDREKWYSRWDLQGDFNVKGPTITRWIRSGLIKVRRVQRKGHEDALVFLIEDNKDFLPPKKLVESYSHTERTNDDGTFTVRIEPWYRHVDPYIHLKGYKIIDQLQFVNGELEIRKAQKEK